MDRGTRGSVRDGAGRQAGRQEARFETRSQQQPWGETGAGEETEDPALWRSGLEVPTTLAQRRQAGAL